MFARRLTTAVVAVVSSAALVLAPSAPGFTGGNVFVSVQAANGLPGSVLQFQPDGSPAPSGARITPVTSANSPNCNRPQGTAFDAMGNFYIVCFDNPVFEFAADPPNAQSTFGTYGSNKLASIAFDAAGNAYVAIAGNNTVNIHTGNVGGAFWKFDSTGTRIAVLPQPVDHGGVGFIDLAPDNCTIYYTVASRGDTTSYRRNVLTFNVCTNTAGSDFATGLGSASDIALGLRLLPTGGLIVADTTQLLRLNASGTPVQTYDATSENDWVGVALDPDGQSFWAADMSTHDVYRFNIASGAVISSFASGTQQVNGISVGNQITVAQALRLTLTPHLAENLIGTTLTLTAHLTDAGIDQPGVPITFHVSGANAASGTATTNASGVATFTYTGVNAGTDTTSAAFVASDGTSAVSDTGTAIWDNPNPPDATITIGPSGTNPVSMPHVFTAHVQVNTGPGGTYVNAPDGTQISFTLDSGPGSFATANPCTTSGGTGSCSITLVSAVPGTSIVSAHTTLTVSGVTLHRDSLLATKLWADDQVTTAVRNAAGADVTGQTVPLGTLVHDEATVAKVVGTPSAVPDPTGTVNFTLYDNGSCTGNVLASDQNEPLSGGKASSVGFTAVAGSFSYRAHYNGQSGVYLPHDGPCEPFSAAAQPGRIVIRKVTVPSPDPSNTSFGFSAAGGLSPTSFTLTNGGSQSFDNVAPQSGYSVTESPTAGWATTSSCDNGSPVTNITVNPGQTVTCTFTNTKLATLIVRKVTVPSPDPSNTSFAFTAGGGLTPASFSLTNGGTQTFANLAPKSGYTLAESATTGWRAASSCDNGNAVGNITLAPGQTVTCTFTNTKLGTFVIRKVTVPSPDPSNTSFLFTPSGFGVTPVSLQNGGTATIPNVVPGGGYSVSEAPQTGWQLTSATCDNGNPITSITIAPGQTVTCTFTNTKLATLIVHKVTVPSPDPSNTSFAFTAGGGLTPASFSLTNGGQQTFANLAPKSGYTLAETSTAGWASASSCDNGNAVGNITLAAGQTVTCTFTNTKLAIDARITIGPDGTNPVGVPHVFTGHVDVNDGAGGGFVSAPNGTLISFTIDSGPGSFVGANPCTTSGGSGSCSISLVSATAGTTRVNAHVTLTVAGVSLHRDTDGTGGNSGPATKLWADDQVATSVRNAAGADVTGQTVPLGTLVHDEATVSKTAATPASLAAPAGTVDFTLFDNGTCNGQILAVDAGKPLSNGIAVSVGFAATSGAFSYRAHYNGQAGVYPAHDGPCEPFSASAQPGRIVVRKVTDPNPDPSNTSFNFTAAGGLSPGGFSLANGQTRTFDNLTPQSGYSLTEGATTGWQLTSATCDDASPITNIALSPGETVTCTFTNTRLSNGHSISGHIWRNSNGNPLGSAEIQACPDPPDTACRSTSSGADGSYRFDNLPDHTNGAADHHWTLTVNPPGGLGLGSGTLGPILLSGTDLTGQDLILASATVIPDGASITTPSGGILTSGIAVTLYGDPITLRIHGCAPGAGTALLRLPLGYTQSVALVSDGPGTYVAIFAAPSPFDGTGSISWTLDCGTTGGFDIYIDPSGVVRTVSGDPVAGATVTLYRSDLAAGPFVQVPNLSAIMSPGNQANPDTTDATGHFGWDVLAGYYKVRAQKAGCTAPGSGAPFVESDVLTIPPAVIDLDLRLDCRSAPGAPTGVTATPGNGSATLAWSAPASDGGAPVTFYDVTRYVGGVAQGTITVPPNTAFTMTGLANGTTYTFKVAARNAIGTGPQSVESNAVTPRRVPDPPTNVTATAGNGEATVSWSAPAFNGGSAITGYVLTRYVAGAVQGTTTVGVATQATVTGLANGSSYTFFVAAVNAAGTGSSSAPSNPVTPAAPKFTLVVARSGTGGGTVTSSVGGINCGTTCSVDLSAGTSVTLTAVPTAGSTFAGWSGACSGVGSCSVTMDADRNTTAIFNAVLTPAAAPCVVPNVKRKPLATAKRRIGTAHCRTGRVTRARSRTVPKGSVISQSPKAGKKLAPGSKVNLVVSRGKR